MAIGIASLCAAVTAHVEKGFAMSSLGFRFEDFADYKDPTAGERAQNKLVNLFPIGSDAENLRSFLQEIGSDCRIYKEDPNHIICRYDHIEWIGDYPGVPYPFPLEHSWITKIAFDQETRKVSLISVSFFLTGP